MSYKRHGFENVTSPVYYAVIVEFSLVRLNKLCTLFLSAGPSMKLCWAGCGWFCAIFSSYQTWCVGFERLGHF